MALADDPEGFRVLQRQRLRIRGRERGGGLRQITVRHAALAGGMDHDTRLGRETFGRHIPARGCRSDQQSAHRGADAAQAVILQRRGHAAAGHLATVDLGVGDGLLDRNRRPVDVQLLGDQHRQSGLDALPHLGNLGGDGHLAVGRDAHIGVDLGVARRLAFRRHGEAQQQAAAQGRPGLKDEATGRVAQDLTVHDQAFSPTASKPAATLIAFLMRM